VVCALGISLLLAGIISKLRRGWSNWLWF
jgi:hypothetical protein